MVVVLLAGCGGDDDNEPSRSPEATARAWVEAINAEDHERACELSVVKSEESCLDLMRQQPYSQDVKFESFYSDLDERGGDQPRLVISFKHPDRAGIADFEIERHGDEYLVHWEAGTIRYGRGIEF